MVEKMYEISMLYDFYGELLTEKQKSILQLYYEDNYTLGEIAEEKEISRQAVHDTVHKAERSLYNYEEKLGLVSRFRHTQSDISQASEAVSKIMAKRSEDAELLGELKPVLDILDRLEEG